MHVGHIRLPSVFIHHKDFQRIEAAKPKSKKAASAKSPYPKIEEGATDLKDGTLLDQVNIFSLCINYYIMHDL